jgi:hypothetical protein
MLAATTPDQCAFTIHQVHKMVEVKAKRKPKAADFLTPFLCSKKVFSAQRIGIKATKIKGTSSTSDGVSVYDKKFFYAFEMDDDS